MISTKKGTKVNPGPHFLTAVVCAYNEEKTLPYVLKGVKPYVDNILVVIATKTKDKTEKIARDFGAEVIFDRGKGKGDAIRCAFDHLKDGIAVFIDADGSHDPQDIPKMVEPMIKGKMDMVIGSRMTGGSDELHGTLSEFWRLFFSSIITLIINYRFRACITDYQNGFRAIKVKVGKKLDLVSNITTIEQEEGIKALKKGFKVGEVPAHEYKRKGGVSKVSVIKMGLKYFLQILRDIW